MGAEPHLSNLMGVNHCKLLSLGNFFTKFKVTQQFCKAGSRSTLRKNSQIRIRKKRIQMPWTKQKTNYTMGKRLNVAAVILLNFYPLIYLLCVPRIKLKNLQYIHPRMALQFEKKKTGSIGGQKKKIIYPWHPKIAILC